MTTTLTPTPEQIERLLRAIDHQTRAMERRTEGVNQIVDDCWNTTTEPSDLIRLAAILPHSDNLDTLLKRLVDMRDQLADWDIIVRDDPCAPNQHDRDERSHTLEHAIIAAVRADYLAQVA